MGGHRHIGTRNDEKWGSRYVWGVSTSGGVAVTITHTPRGYVWGVSTFGGVAVTITHTPRNLAAFDGENEPIFVSPR